MSERGARRFLHVCYCCADEATVIAMFTDALGLRRTMGTPVARGSGAILGLDGDIISGASFLYDARGPRAGPAIEVQTWVEPPVAGTPPSDPTLAGIQALGFAVADVDAAAQRLVAGGCTPLSQASLRDPVGVTLDLVAGADAAPGQSRMHHVRITCTDLDRSLDWYRGLGFVDVDVDRAADTAADTVRLRLPDDPFEAVLVQWRTPPSHGRHTDEPNRAGLYRVAVAVDDVRAAHARLHEQGWTFDRAPMAVELRGTNVPEMWICFLRDPDGVPFELVERPRAAFAST